MNSNYPKKKTGLDEEAWAAWLGIEPTGAGKKAGKKAGKPVPALQYRQPGSHKPGQPVDGMRGEPKRPPHLPQKHGAAETPGGSSQPAVSIQIHLPEFHIPRPHIPWGALKPWLIGAATLVLVVFGGKFIVDRLPKHETTQPKTPVNAQASADLGYKPLVPSARAEGEAAPSAPAYNSQKKLYTYNDQYKGANLTVDQQAIPEKLKGNEAEIAKLAHALNTTDSFTTTLGKVYIFTSETSGAQRLMLANDKMLMFIQSTQTVDTADWVHYIQDLQ